MTAAIALQDLSRRFGPVSAVAGLTLEIPPGELFGLVGPDGAGKTTTLRMLAGILPPSAGDARVAGFSIGRKPERVKSRIAYMSQRFGLYGDLTVRENLDFYADLFEVPKAQRPDRIRRLLEFSGLSDFGERLADKLSGGMRQKLGLACALVHRPEIVLLDEPTNGVDPVSRRDFWRILYDMLKQGVTILMTTAYLDEAERCNRVGLMYQGRLMAVDTPARVKALLRAQLAEITVSDGWRAREALARVPEARGITVFGQRVHVALADLEHGLPAVLGALEAAGFAPRDARPIAPSLEDAFISLVEGEGRQEPAHDR